MERGIFPCPPAWAGWLPPGVRPLDRTGERLWELLVLLPEGPGRLEGPVRCCLALAPGEASLGRVQAERVVTYGLSARDSLTLSSLAEPVLCVQRSLPRPGGGEIEPQEVPLPPLPLPAAELLPLLGLRLLTLPPGELWPFGPEGRRENREFPRENERLSVDKYRENGIMEPIISEMR